MAASLEAVGSLISGDMVAAAATHAARAAGQAALTRIATYIYEKITAVPDLSEEEYTSYQKLIACYREHLTSPTDPLPEHWGLDGKKPCYRSTFKEQHDSLLGELSKVEKADSALIWQIHGIVTTIGELYCSLDKRVKVFGKDLKTGENQYREDGFESMFYTELATWLVGVLPTLSLTDKQTAAKVGARLNYCKSVYAGVIVYHKDKDIACPRNVLPVVMEALEVLHANLIQAHHAASFSERVSTINRQLTSTIAGSLNVLYMMLEGIRLRDLNVSEVLSPSDGRVLKIKETVHETKLGQWLMTTLQVAGIQANDFACHKNISIPMIHAHLPDVSLLDKEDISTSGLPPFVWWRERSWAEFVIDPTQVQDRVAFKKDPATILLLTRIRDFHRAILTLCALRQALGRLAQLQIAYGEKWLFDSEEGDLLFEGLKYALERSLIEFKQTLDIFWQDFYVERHTRYVDERRTDPTDATYRQLAKADKLVSRIRESLQKINHSKDELVIYRSAVLASSERHIENLRALSAFLYDYLPTIEYRDTAKLARFRALGLIRGAGGSAGAGAGAAAGLDTDVIELPRTEVLRGAGSASSPIGAAVPSLTPEDQARADMIEVLCQTGLDKKELQPAWIEEGYRLFLPSYATLGEVAQEEVKGNYERAVRKAKEFAASTMALRLISEWFGQDLEYSEIKAEWIEKASYLFFLQLQGVADSEQVSAKRDYDAVVQDLDRIKKLAEVKAWLALCDYTGQPPEEILTRWIYRAAPLFLITPATTAAKRELVRAAYKKVLAMAAEHFGLEPGKSILFPEEEAFPDDTIEALANSQAALAICRDVKIAPSRIEPGWISDAAPLFVMGVFEAPEAQKALAYSEYQNVLARIKASLAAARITAGLTPALPEAAAVETPPLVQAPDGTGDTQVNEAAMQLTVELATSQAVALLCQETGQPPQKLKENWIEVVARKLLCPPSAPGFTEAKAAYEAVLREAYDFFNESEEEKMPGQRSIVKHSCPVAEMKLALEIEKIIQGYLGSTRGESCTKQSLPPAGILKILKTPFHQAIYNTILKPYAGILSNDFLASLYGYREKHLKLLEKYFSCLASVLTAIEEAAKIRAISETELQSIKEQLLAVLDCMYRDCPWVKAALTLYLKEKPHALVSLDAAGGEVVVSSEAKIASLTSAVAERDRAIRVLEATKRALAAENTELKAENTELKAEKARLEAENAQLAAKNEHLDAEIKKLSAQYSQMLEFMAKTQERFDLLEREVRAKDSSSPASKPGLSSDGGLGAGGRFFDAGSTSAAGGCGGIAGPAGSSQGVRGTGM